MSALGKMRREDQTVAINGAAVFRRMSQAFKSTDMRGWYLIEAHKRIEWARQNRKFNDNAGWKLP